MKNEEITKKYYRPREAAIYLGVCVSTIWNWIAEEKLKTKKLGEKITVIDKYDLDNFVEIASLANTNCQQSTV